MADTRKMARRIVNGLGTAGTAATQLLAADDTRIRLVIDDDSGADIYVGGSDSVDTTSGVVVTNSTIREFSEYVGPVWVVAGTDGNVFHWYTLNI